jgi:hypothetical protein
MLVVRAFSHNAGRGTAWTAFQSHLLQFGFWSSQRHLSDRPSRRNGRFQFGRFGNEQDPSHARDETVTNNGTPAQPSGSGISKPFRNLAILSGILALVCASPIGQIVYVVGMISVIGIPLAFLVEAIPTIGLVIGIGYLLWRFVPPFGGWTPAISVAAACILLLMVPPVHNAEIELKVAALTSGNTGPASGPGQLPRKAGQALALISRRNRPSLCDQICLHLLMSEEARRVLMVPLEEGRVELDPAMRAYSYSLERRARCPDPKIAGAGARTHSRNFRKKDPETISGRYAIMLEQGYCLTIANANLGDADLAFLVANGPDFPVPATVSPIAAGIVASRAAISAPNGNGQWAPLWQQTAVSYSFLGPVLMPRFKIQAGMSGTSVGWWRDDFRTGQPQFRSLSALIRAAGINLPEEIR